MSLFPAYTSGEITNHESVNVVHDSWLSNVSFTPAPRKDAQDVSNELTDIDKEVQIVIPSETQQKVRKEERGERRKKKKQKHQKSREKPSSSRSGAKVESIFLHHRRDLSLNVPTYVVDVNQAIDNLNFDSTYKRQRAEIVKRRRVCLGASTKINELLNEGLVTGKDKPWRYFSKKNKILGRTRPMQKTMVQGDFQGDFVPLIPRCIEEKGQQLVYDSTIQMYRLDFSSIAYDDITISDTENDEFMLSSKRFNKLLADNPHNINLWMQFLEHQDIIFEYTTLGQGLKMTKTGLAERKAAILEKALASNPTSVELKLLKIDLGVELGWDRAKFDESWRNLEFQYVNNIKMWKKRLSSNYFQFNQFTLHKKATIYLNCLHKLWAVMSGHLVTHPMMPDTDRFFVYVLAASVELWLNAGHTEKALAICQALLEFNFRSPAEIVHLNLEEKRKFFELIWDSGAQRIGEEDSKGWAFILKEKPQTYSTSTSLRDSNQELLDEMEQQILSDCLKSERDCWLSIENLRSEFAFKPFNWVDQEPEDPERVVVFEDIEKYLYPIDNSLNRIFLIVELLSVFGFMFPPLLSSNQSNLSDNWYLSGSYEHFGTLPALNMIQFKDFDHFILRVLEALCACMENDSHRTFLKFCIITDRAMKLVRDLSKSSKERTKLLKVFCKEFLARSEHRNNILLYVAYAKGLFKLGSVDEALSTLQLAMNGSLKCNLKSECSEENTVALYCLNVYVDMYLFKKNSKKDLENLYNVLGYFVEHDEFIAPAPSRINVLKCKRKFEELYVLIMQKFEMHTIDFYKFWLGDAFTLFTRLFVVIDFLSCTSSDCNTIFDNARKFLDEKANVHGLKDEQQVDLLRIEKEKEFLWEWELNLDYLRLEKNQITPKCYRERLLYALEAFPSNYRLLKRFCDLNISCYALTKLRQFFNHKSSDFSKKTVTIRRLASIYANFTIFLKYQDADDCTGCSFEFVRKTLEKSVEISNEAPILWRLYLNLEWEFSKNDKLAQRIFYQGVRQCPDSKLLYLDFVRILRIPEEMRRVLDMMVEKGVRVRLPWEEFDLLWRNERKTRPFECVDSEDDQSETVRIDHS